LNINSNEVRAGNEQKEVREYGDFSLVVRSGDSQSGKNAPEDPRWKFEWIIETRTARDFYWT
jgi:hypothetical protein